MAQDLSQEILDTLRDIKNGLGGKGGSGTSAGGSAKDKTAAELSKDLKKLQSDVLESSENLNKLNKNGILPSNKALQEKAEKERRYNKDVEATAAKLKSVNEGLKQLEGQTGADAEAKRASLEQSKKLLVSHQRSLEAEAVKQEMVQKTFSGLSTAASAYMSIAEAEMNAMSQITSAIQAGGNGFNLLAAASNAGAAMEMARAQIGAQAAQSLGNSLQALGGKAAVAGSLISMLGGIAERAAAMQKQATELRNSMFMQAGEKFANSFKAATSAGAIFANGADGMNNAIKDSRLLLGDLGDVIKENKANFAHMGMSMEDAVSQIGRVGANLKKSGVDKDLMKLGFSFKEQANLMADVMSTMQRANPEQAMTDAQIAQTTKQYAKDLALIGSLSAQDAKQKMAAVQAANDNLNYKQQENKLVQQYGPQYAKAMEGMAGAFSDKNRARMQADMGDMMANNGEIVNKQGRALAAVSPAYKSMMQEMYESAKNGTASAENSARIQAKYGDAIRKQVLSAEGIGRASQLSDGYSREIAGSLSDAAEFGQITAKKVEAGIKNVDKTMGDKGEKKPEDKLGKTIVDTATIMNDFQKKMDNYVIKNLPAWSNAVIASLRQMEAQWSGSSPGTGLPKWLEYIASLMAKYGVVLMLAVQAFQLLAPAMKMFGNRVGEAGELANKANKAAKAGEAGKGKIVEAVDKRGRTYHHEEGNKMATRSKADFEAQQKAKPTLKEKLAPANAGMAGKLAGGAAIVGNVMAVAGAMKDVMDSQKKYEEAKKAGDKEGMKEARASQGEAAGSAAGSLAGGAIGMMLGGPIGAAVGSYIGEMAGGILGKAVGPYWDDITASASKMWDTTKETFSQLGTKATETVTAIWGGTKEFATKGAEIFMSVFSNIKATAMSFITDISGFLGKAGGMIWDAIKASPLFSVGKVIMDAVMKSPLGTFATWMTGIVSSVFDKIKEIGASALSWIGDKLKSLNPANWFGGGDEKKAAPAPAATAKPADAATAKAPAPTTGAPAAAQTKAATPTPPPAAPAAVKAPELSKSTGALSEKDMPRLLDDNRKLMEALLKQNQAMASSLGQIAQYSSTSARAAEKMVRNTS